MIRLAIALTLVLAGTASAAEWKRLPGPTPTDHGRAVFESRCAICHGTDPDAAGTNSLAVKYGKDKPALLEQRRDLKPETVKFFVRKGAGMMPFFRKTEVSDAELEALAAYLSRKR